VILPRRGQRSILPTAFSPPVLAMHPHNLEYPHLLSPRVPTAPPRNQKRQRRLASDPPAGRRDVGITYRLVARSQSRRPGWHRGAGSQSACNRSRVSVPSQQLHWYSSSRSVLPKCHVAAANFSNHRFGWVWPPSPRYLGFRSTLRFLRCQI